jgi:hypothetical protein
MKVRSHTTRAKAFNSPEQTTRSFPSGTCFRKLYMPRRAVSILRFIETYPYIGKYLFFSLYECRNCNPFLLNKLDATLSQKSLHCIVLYTFFYTCFLLNKSVMMLVEWIPQYVVFSPQHQGIYTVSF